MDSEFNFWQNWYPISPLEDLDTQRPTAVTLLGMRLVICPFPDSPSRFKVFLDQCPHRLAPLSEGRLDEKTGNLMCSYHGWEFNREGICTRIPQAENPDLVKKNPENFCLTVFPSQQANGLLWVWADGETPALSAQTPLPLSPQIDAGLGFVWSSVVRDLEYDWSTLVENVADPSHVPFAHHGVQGKRGSAKPIPIEIVRSTDKLIEARIGRELFTTITFRPPCLLEYAIKFGDKGQQLGLVTYCLPVGPNKSRIVAQFPRNFAKTLHTITPRWWNHITVRNLVLDGDMILLHQQERFLHQMQLKESWKTAYKLPTSADRLVIEFRRWYDSYCQGKLPWEKVGITAETNFAPKENRREVLDRYRQHTQHCSSCRQALKVTQVLQGVLLGYVVLGWLIASLLPESWRMAVGVPLLVTELLGLGGYLWLKFWLEPRFYFVDYVHAQKK